MTSTPPPSPPPSDSSRFPPDRDAGGYRLLPGHGPQVRSDIVDLYIARQSSHQAGLPDLLQLRRSKPPLLGTWQPIMGHIEPGESAPRAALREMFEEIGLAPADPAIQGIWALEQVHPFYIAAINCIVLSPRFVVLVAPGFEPPALAEHDAARWVNAAAAADHFVWPGQLASIRELTDLLARPTAPAYSLQRIDRHSYARP